MSLNASNMKALKAPRMKALVLAGGKGTRLRPLTYAMAKQLVPVANKPILFYPLDELYGAGIREFGIIISPETGDSIQEAVKTWQPADVTITFILQDRPSGLAHAVKTAQDFIQTSPFVMYLGDNLINGQLSEQISDFFQNPCEASILLTPVDNPASFGVAELDASGQAVKLVEKPKNPPSNLALEGVYLFQPKIFEAIDQLKPSWRGEYEITDAIQTLIDWKCTVRTRIHEGWWLDTGKKDDLLAANRVVLDAYPQNSQDSSSTVDSHSILKGAVSIGKQSQIIRCQIEGPVRIADNCVLQDCHIGPYTSIGSGCRLSSITLSNSVLLERCQLKNVQGPISESLIGQDCQIQGTPDQSHQFLLADHSILQV